MKIVSLTAIVAVLVLTGCGGGGSDSQYEATSPSAGAGTTNVYAGGDVTLNQTVVADGGTYIYNGDGTVTFISGDGNYLGDTNPEPTGDYDHSDDAQECAANGYFWCPISQQCLNKPANGSSCSGS